MHFGPYVTFQPCIRQFWPTLRHFFGPVAMLTNKHFPPLSPNPNNWANVILGEKTKKWKKINKIGRTNVKFHDFLLNHFVMWILIKWSCGEYILTLMYLLSNMRSSRKLSVLSDDESVKTRVLSGRFTTSLGHWVKVHSYQCGAGHCGGDVRPWLLTGKVYGGGDVHASSTRETQHQLLSGIQQNCHTVDRMTGVKGQIYIVWA